MSKKSTSTRVAVTGTGRGGLPLSSSSPSLLGLPETPGVPPSNRANTEAPAWVEEVQ